MALNIKDGETDRLARELSAMTGESITVAVKVALRDRLERLTGAAPRERRLRELKLIATEAAALPVLDPRPAEEILGYDRHGLPS